MLEFGPQRKTSQTDIYFAWGKWHSIIRTNLETWLVKLNSTREIDYVWSPTFISKSSWNLEVFSTNQNWYFPDPCNFILTKKIGIHFPQIWATILKLKVDSIVSINLSSISKSFMDNLSRNNFIESMLHHCSISIAPRESLGSLYPNCRDIVKSNGWYNCPVSLYTGALDRWFLCIPATPIHIYARNYLLEMIVISDLSEFSVSYSPVQKFLYQLEFHHFFVIWACCFISFAILLKLEVNGMIEWKVPVYIYSY